MEDLNLHFTGDVHAVGMSNNLACAFLDNFIFKGNPLNINPEKIYLRRVLDVSDRFLRNIKIGLGGKDDGAPRDTGFDIAVASEVMAILALTTSLADLRKRLGRMVVAEDFSGKPVTADQLGVAGSMCILLKDAIKPNLIQTLEHSPVMVMPARLEISPMAIVQSSPTRLPCAWPTLWLPRRDSARIWERKNSLT